MGASNHVVGANLAMVVWAIAALVTMTLVLAIASRWHRLGRHAALTVPLGAALFVSIATLVWVLPGFIAALVVIGGTGVRGVIARRAVAE